MYFYLFIYCDNTDIYYNKRKCNSRGICTMSKYVYAPAGSIKLRNELLKSGVEFIGLHQSGFGSSWAKGKRYIKNELRCSGTAIKKACIVKDRMHKHDFKQYGTEVYYYHKDYCSKIVKIILDYLVLHIKDPALPQAFANADFATLLNLTYSHRISQIKWVSIINYQEQGNDAERIYNDLNNLQ